MRVGIAISQTLGNQMEERHPIATELAEARSEWPQFIEGLWFSYISVFYWVVLGGWIICQMWMARSKKVSAALGPVPTGGLLLGVSFAMIQLGLGLAGMCEAIKDPFWDYRPSTFVIDLWLLSYALVWMMLFAFAATAFVSADRFMQFRRNKVAQSRRMPAQDTEPRTTVE